MKLKDLLFEDLNFGDEYLYHVTHIDKLGEIKNKGLVPKFGELVKSTSGYDYWLDHIGGRDLPPEAKEIEGVIFFSEKPSLGYYNVGRKRSDIKKVIDSKILVCVVKKNPSIYKFVDNGRGEVLNYKERGVSYIEWYNHRIQTKYLPYFIEPGDWFAFEHQKVEKLLYGEELVKFIKNNFPEQIK